MQSLQTGEIARIHTQHVHVHSRMLTSLSVCPSSTLLSGESLPLWVRVSCV
jgi:hypothetical protein